MAQQARRSEGAQDGARCAQAGALVTACEALEAARSAIETVTLALGKAQCGSDVDWYLIGVSNVRLAAALRLMHPTERALLDALDARAAELADGCDDLSRGCAETVTLEL
jgi:hypothetical protein